MVHRLLLMKPHREWFFWSSLWLIGCQFKSPDQKYVYPIGDLKGQVIDTFDWASHCDLAILNYTPSFFI